MVKTMRPSELDEFVRFQLRNAMDGKTQKLVGWVEGPPGIGKSSIPKQACKDLGVRMFDVRLSGHEPSDFSLPVKQDDGSIRFIPPDEFDELCQAENGPVLLFLDEITHAKPPVQSVAFKMVLDRMIGYRELRDNVVVFVAGNSLNEGGLYDLQEPLQDRFIKFRMEANLEDTLEYAMKKGWNPQVRGYLEYKKAKALFSMDNNDKPTTPRGWERVSDILKSNLSDALKWKCVSGSVGAGRGTEFRAFYNLRNKIPKLSDVLKNPQLLVDLFNDSPDIYLSLRGVIEEEMTPTEILGLLKEVPDAEIQMQMLKPMIDKLINAEQDSDYAKWLNDDDFLSELTDFTINANEEQQKIISQFLEN